MVVNARAIEYQNKIPDLESRYSLMKKMDDAANKNSPAATTACLNTVEPTPGAKKAGISPRSANAVSTAGKLTAPPKARSNFSVRLFESLDEPSRIVVVALAMNNSDANRAPELLTVTATFGPPGGLSNQPATMLAKPQARVPLPSRRMVREPPDR